MIMLSVVIPTYNRSRLVVEAIESVLAQQDFSSIEIIVVDDGSQDDTRATLQPYVGRIKYLHQANGGMNAARNAGIRAATGKYVALLDSDDAWLPFKAALQIAVLEKLPSVGFAFSNFFAWRQGTRAPNGLGAWMTPDASLEGLASAHYSSASLDIESPAPFNVHVCNIYHLSLHQPVVLPSTSVVRRSVFEALGPLQVDNWMCGDWEYFAHASRVFGAAYIDIETTLNRSHDDGVRLMRRALADRTKQRIASIRRTWRADATFMASFADEVNAVEARERRSLFKLSCYGGDLVAAREQLREIANISGGTPLSLSLLLAFMHLPFSRQAISALRSRAR